MEFLSEEHIFENSKELYKKPKINGLYFLIYKTKIVYIGSGNDVHKRISAHKQTRVLRFNRYYIKELHEKGQELFNIEAKYIAHYRPIYNKTSNPDYHNNSKLIWFTYISQEKSVADIANEINERFQTVNNIIQGNRNKKDEIFLKVIKCLKINIDDLPDND